MNDQDIILKTVNLRKQYHLGETIVHALRGVSLEIPRGAFFLILGPSGSGKTTLLDMLGALDVPTSGKIYIDGKDISKLDSWHLSLLRRKKIGFIFQTFNLIPTLDAVDNVMLPALPFTNNEPALYARAIRLLREVGLGRRLSHKPAQMSGGERQRVAIARALINDPEVILADEPTGNLDTKTGMHIMDILSKLHKEHNKTIVAVTHDIRLKAFADKIVHLKDGTIEYIEDGGNANTGL